MRNLPRGTVTFLFTDIEGSTRLLAEPGSEYADALAEHRRLLREAFRAHGGVEVDTQGDAFFYAFAAAAEAQETVTSGPIRVRMGVHTGEPQLTDEGYVGLDVHAGARVAACAHGGQVVLTKRTRDLVDATFRFRDLGEHRLKDLNEAVWLYQLGDELWLYQLGDELFPPLKSLSNTNLPILVSSFLGRETELAEAQALLDDTRLLTVSGPGGTGKTRFSIELASRQLDDCPNGVFWVPLAPLRDPALVTEEAGRVLGAKDGLAAHIGDKRMLVLLDNFEQVVEAAPALGDVLRACPNLRLLVTSRETLRIDGETEFALPPLVEEEGVALFSSRARVEPSPAVRELCRRLDGLPLAIELAAARAKVLPPEALLPRLTERLDLLRGGRDAEARHATLRATIAWSYELLEPGEQQLFARFGVFAGGCTLAAAEEVCGADLDTLQALLDKSLLRRTGDRYWMLETIREFALERHAERSDAAETLDGWNEYFVGLADDAYAEIRGSEQVVWMARLEADHDNLRETLARAKEMGDAELELRLAVDLAQFRSSRGYLTEGRLALEEALAVGKDPKLRARALHAAGFMALNQGLHDKAEALLGEGWTLARELDDVRLAGSLLLTLAAAVSDRDEARAEALYEELLIFVEENGEEHFPRAFINLAEFALRRGDYASAELYSRKSLLLLREEGDTWSTALALGNLGLALLGLGREAEACERLAESLRLHEIVGDKLSIAAGLSTLASVIAERGELERAARLLAHSDLLVGEIGAVLPPRLEGALHERTLVRVRADVDNFETVWSQGRDMTVGEAVAEALLGVAKTKA